MAQEQTTYYTSLLDALKGVSFSVSFTDTTYTTILTSENGVVAFMQLTKSNIDDDTYQVRKSYAMKGLGQVLYSFTTMYLTMFDYFIVHDNLEYMSKDAIKLWKRFHKLKNVVPVKIKNFDEHLAAMYHPFVQHKYQMLHDERFTKYFKDTPITEAQLVEAINLYDNYYVNKVC